MDSKMKLLIGIVLLLIGLAAVGVIMLDYQQCMSKGFFCMWRWSSGEILQIIAGIISVGAGIFLIATKGDH